MALKIVYPICCGIDVHKSFVVAYIATTNDKGVTTYKSTDVPPLRAIFACLPNGLRKTIAGMSVWSLRANTGFPSTTC